MPSENNKSFKVLILAGGYATRLYPITLDMSKPLLKIDKRAIIDFSIKQLCEVKELKKIFVVTNDKFYKDYLSWKKKLRIKKKIVIINDGTKTEKSRLGAIGDIYYVVKNEKICGDLLVIGGDNIFERDLTSFIKFAQKNSPCASIGIYNLKRKILAKRYGVVKVDENHLIVDFQEKPKHPQSTHIAMCVYFFPKETSGYLKEYIDNKFSTDKSGDYIKWLMTKIKVYGFHFGGLWLDIGEIDTYAKAYKYFSGRR